MLSSEEPSNKPSSPKSESTKEKNKEPDIYSVIFSASGLFKLIFSRRKSTWRAILFAAVGLFLYGGASLYYNNPHTTLVLEVVSVMLIIGGLFMAFAARQAALNYIDKITWPPPNGAWWITFICYCGLAVGTCNIERPNPRLVLALSTSLAPRNNMILTNDSLMVSGDNTDFVNSPIIFLFPWEEETNLSLQFQIRNGSVAANIEAAQISVVIPKKLSSRADKGWNEVLLPDEDPTVEYVWKSQQKLLPGEPEVLPLLRFPTKDAASFNFGIPVLLFLRAADALTNKLNFSLKVFQLPSGNHDQITPEVVERNRIIKNPDGSFTFNFSNRSVTPTTKPPPIITK